MRTHRPRGLSLAFALLLALIVCPSIAHADPDICNPDLDDDGMVGAADASRLISCYGGRPAGFCSIADVNCDGNIDGCDIAVMRCSWGGPIDPACCRTVRCGACTRLDGSCDFVSEADCAAPMESFSECLVCDPAVDVLPPACDGPPICTCNPDVTGDMFNDDRDGARLLACIEGTLGEAACTLADINCDGVVDLCDLGIRELAGGASGDMLALCAAAECGTCVLGPECFRAERTMCEADGGEFRGADGECPMVDPPDAAPGPDAGPTPDASPSPDTRPRPTPGDDVASFRGSGGCGCRAAHGPANVPWLLAFAFAVVVWRTGRRA